MAPPRLPDRMAAGDGTEKIVSREEAPVDVNAKVRRPRVVFPPLNQNGNPPSAASVAPGGLPPASAGNGTLPNNEPRKIRTLTVKGDQPDSGGVPAGAGAAAGSEAGPGCADGAAAPPPAARRVTRHRPMPAPMRRCRWCRRRASRLLTAEPPTRVAAPTRSRPRRLQPAGGGYLVQVSSQRSEADAQASFRALQGKFPAVLGSHSPVIKRADLGEKGVYYRAMVGPFGTSEEAVAVLRQPEVGRRAVRRPKELTAVSLTPGLAAG